VGFVDASILPEARRLIRNAFESQVPAAAPKATVPTATSLVRQLEQLTGMSRHDWPPSLLRSFWEALMEHQDGRRFSVEHEARWLNLTGFCLRPGYGLAVDDWRVGQVWRLNAQKVMHPRNELCRAEWWILWRRIAGGLTAGQQLTLAEPLVAAMRSRLRAAGPIAQGKSSPFQYGPHETAEVWRLLGSLELLRTNLKEELGQTALDLLPREKTAAVQNAVLFTIGRLGSRVPVYGPLDALVRPDLAEEWARLLLQVAAKLQQHKASPTEAASRRTQIAFALVQLARLTGDRYRDISDSTRKSVIEYLSANAAPPHYVQLVREGGELADEEQKLTFGESLPRGLRIP
jgi:hypothetical protein